MKVMYGFKDDEIGNLNLQTLSSADIAGINWIYHPDGQLNRHQHHTFIRCQYGLNYQPCRYQLCKRGEGRSHPEWGNKHIRYWSNSRFPD